MPQFRRLVFCYCWLVGCLVRSHMYNDFLLTLVGKCYIPGNPVFSCARDVPMEQMPMPMPDGWYCLEGTRTKICVPKKTDATIT